MDIKLKFISHLKFTFVSLFDRENWMKQFCCKSVLEGLENKQSEHRDRWNTDRRVSESAVSPPAGHVPERWRRDRLLFRVAEESEPCQLRKTDLQIRERLKLPPAQWVKPWCQFAANHRTWKRKFSFLYSLFFVHFKTKTWKQENMERNVSNHLNTSLIHHWFLNA